MKIENCQAGSEAARVKDALKKIAAPLLNWYQSNARDLPWRHTRDPYRIWISEIMLQQTRVSAVLDYYRRFLEKFPDVYALAAAPEEDLLSLWQGLGYYSRARNLQRAARQIAALGAFPDNYPDLLKLPGVGDYTAAAIASAAFALPYPAIDGNALRVIARLADCHLNISAPETKKIFGAALPVNLLQSKSEIRIFNQSVMELGAVICVPNGPPHCDTCPLSAQCLARQNHTIEILPVKAAKKARRVEHHTILILSRFDPAEYQTDSPTGDPGAYRVAARKRPESGLLANLWEFPNLPGELSETEIAAQIHDWNFNILHWHQKISAKHIFTHIEWHMTGYFLTVSGPGPDSFHWLDAAKLTDYAIPSAFAKFRQIALERITEHESS